MKVLSQEELADEKKILNILEKQKRTGLAGIYYRLQGKAGKIKSNTARLEKYKLKALEERKRSETSTNNNNKTEKPFWARKTLTDPNEFARTAVPKRKAESMLLSAQRKKFGLLSPREKGYGPNEESIFSTGKYQTSSSKELVYGNHHTELIYGNSKPVQQLQPFSRMRRVGPNNAPSSRSAAAAKQKSSSKLALKHL